MSGNDKELAALRRQIHADKIQELEKQRVLDLLRAEQKAREQMQTQARRRRPGRDGEEMAA